MDAIDLLTNDHRTVEQLFTRYEGTTDQAKKTRDELVRDIIRELSIHAVIEEQVFYPAVRLTLPHAEEEVLEAIEEHHIVKWTLSELEKLKPSDERFHPKVTVLIESVRHHVKEEEGEMFPHVRSALSDAQLDELGDRLEAAKQGAPTHPHPRSPDTPPGNVVAGAVVGVVDKARDMGHDAIESARDAIGDAIGDARDAGEEAVQDARRSARRTTRDATKSAKATRRSVARKAKKAARRAEASGRKAVASARKASGSAKKSGRKATGTAKKSGRKAAGTAKKSAKKATGTAKKSGRKAAGTAKKTARKASGRSGR